jgi:hypothetical protein
MTAAAATSHDQPAISHQPWEEAAAQEERDTAVCLTETIPRWRGLGMYFPPSEESAYDVLSIVLVRTLGEWTTLEALIREKLGRRRTVMLATVVPEWFYRLPDCKDWARNWI